MRYFENFLFQNVSQNRPRNKVPRRGIVTTFHTKQEAVGELTKIWKNGQFVDSWTFSEGEKDGGPRMEENTVKASEAPAASSGPEVPHQEDREVDWP